MKVADHWRPSSVIIAALFALVFAVAYFGSLMFDRNSTALFPLSIDNWRTPEATLNIQRTGETALFRQGKLEIPIEIQNVANVFDVMASLRSTRVFLQTADEERLEAKIVPGYRAYSVSNELLQNLPALIVVQVPRQDAAFTLVLDNGQKLETLAAFDIKVGGVPPEVFNPTAGEKFSLAHPISLFLFMLVSMLLTVALCLRLGGTGALDLYLITKSLLLAWHISAPWSDPRISLAAWFALDLFFVVGSFWFHRIPRLPTISVRPLNRSQRGLAIVTFTLGFGFFAWVLLESSGFKWSIFEERDFLSAWDVIRRKTIPTLGPQLLAGGQTPGGGLYLLLAPIVSFFADPPALAVFTKILFMLCLLLVGGFLKKFFGWVPAALGVVVFATSSAIVSCSYWPIHPYMSFFFYLTMLGLGVLAAARDRAAIWAGFGVLVALLCQLHFSYFLILLPVLIFIGWQSAPRGRTRAFAAFAAGLVAVYIPYLLHEITTGGHNWRMIAAKPRFHPIFSPQVPFRPDTAHVGMWVWLDSIHGLWNPIQRNGLQFLLWLGVAGTVSHLLTFNKKSPASAYLGLIFLVFSFSFLFLSLFGMGYSYRHFMTVGVVIPLFAAAGLWYVMRVGGPRLNWAIVPVFALTVAFLIGFFSRPTPDFVRANNEWAVDYNQRLAVAKYMIEDLGLGPEQYRKQVVWWWFGWSISPEVYDMYHQRFLNQNASHIPDDQMIFVLSRELLKASELIFKNFDLHEIKAFPSVLVYQGKPIRRSMPSSNSRNPTRLNPAESEIERSLTSDGLTPLNSGDHQKDFLLSLEQGRIRARLRVHSLESGGLAWNLESPSLSGYYQELKTVWNPRLEFVHKKTGQKITHLLGPDPVLGSFLSKTPLTGEVALPDTVENFDVRLSLDGWFDQSKMTEPMIEAHSWTVNL